MSGEVNKSEGRDILQRVERPGQAGGLCSLSGTEMKVQMKFNKAKFNVLHLHNQRSGQIRICETERDMGVLVTTSHMSQQCTNVTRKANHILGFIHRAITVRPREIIILLSSALVRPRGDLVMFTTFS